MKKTPLLLLLAFMLLNSAYSAFGKAGTIHTYSIYKVSNIAIDNNGILYSAAGKNILRIDSGNSAEIIIGMGSVYGDGGPATAAKLNNARAMTFDAFGNMYIGDSGDGVIRKVSPAKIISTIAGDPALGPGYSGDGGLATNARIGCDGICADMSGNIFVADQVNNVIRKIDASGIITTYAGNGTAGYSGDGGAATSAQISYTPGPGVGPWGIATDPMGNLYINGGKNYVVRKVDKKTGIITTVAGNGHPGLASSGGPALAANLDFPGGLCTDPAGNLYLAEWKNSVLEVVDPKGTINVLAGNNSSGFSGDWGPATAAALNNVSDVAIDPWGNIYIADYGNSKIRKMPDQGITSIYDSFVVRVTPLCNGPRLDVKTNNYTSDMYVRFDFGDGAADSQAIQKTFSGLGFATSYHTYSASGTYPITYTLYRGDKPVDTVSGLYTYTFCRTLPFRIYYEENGNGVKDSTEKLISGPSLTEVYANGVKVDVVSATGGFNYNAYAPSGTNYTFKMIKQPGDLLVAAPVGDSITTTVSSAVASYPDKYFGLYCPGRSSFDLAIKPVVSATGVLDQNGHMYISNTLCSGMGGVVTLTFSPRLTFDASWATPRPDFISGNSASWTLSKIDNAGSKPVDIRYILWAGSKLRPGDTLYSAYTVSPITGDTDPTNNTVVRLDTVRGGCDPNEMMVSPEGCISGAADVLQYTIHFENTGNDTAHNIYVMDTLSDYVDPGSFELDMGSHNMTIGMLRYDGHTVVKFDFADINLLDSSHHGQCDGSVIYRIKLRKDIPAHTRVTNYSGIFFDYNDVVMTNTTENTIGCPLSVTPVASLPAVDIFPNPATNELTIKTEQDTYRSFTITNSLGQQLIQHDISSSQITLNVAHLPAGVYYVSLSGNNGVTIHKFVKM